MVRRRVAALGCALLLIGGACSHNPDMSSSSDMPDSAAVMRAMDRPAARDSMLDTMPGGEMARGDSAAEMRLLREKTGR